MYKKKPWYTKKKKSTSPDTKLLKENKFCDNIIYNISRDARKNRRQFHETLAYYAAYLKRSPDELEVFNAYLLRNYPEASVLPNLGRRLKAAVLAKMKKHRRK